MSETTATPTSSADDESDFELTPQGWQKRWSLEFAAAKKEVKKWHTLGERVVRRYLDERKSDTMEETRWNLFTSNVDTLKSLMFGKTPSVDVGRRYNDAQDDIARVAAQMLERLLNSDIERDDDGYADALEDALEDHLLPGMGNVKLRYVVEYEDVPGEPAQTRPMLDPTGAPMLDEQGQPQMQELAPAVPAHQRKAHENVETDHIYWKDQLWSPCRTFRELRWWAFRAPTTRRDGRRRFGQIFDRVPMNSKRAEKGDGDGLDGEKQDPWTRADVWEIWDRDSRTVFWMVEGMDQILDRKRDPLGLKNFWPFPKPMVANSTTSKFLPRPDYVIAQDLYEEIDRVSTRITRLERAIKVVGVYDAGSPEIQRLLDEACDNELLPATNWGALLEKGGVQGAIQLLPIDQIVAAMDKLREYRSELVSALFQITGMSDIMRGQAQGAATATEQAIKAKFGSVRVQRRQDVFAQFASDTQRIRAEIICKHFDPETILQRSNIGQTVDAELALQAVELLKSDFECYRIVVKPESVSLTDYAANKQEMTELLAAVTQFLQQTLPVGQAVPAFAPGFLRILQAYVARTKGGDVIEGILDEMITQATKMMKDAQAQAAQPKQPQPPDPKIQAAQIKAQGDIAKTHVASQARMQEIGAETKAEIVKRTHDAQMSVAEDEAKDRRDAMRQVNAILPHHGA